jgi:hypothetical protein
LSVAVDLVLDGDPDEPREHGKKHVRLAVQHPESHHEGERHFRHKDPR